MKKIFLLLLFFCVSIFAQDDSELRNSKDSINNKEEEVSFRIIEDFPIAPGCDNVEMDKRMECFSQYIDKHFMYNFKTPKIKGRKGEIVRVFVNFKINIEGICEIIEVKTDEILIKNEIFRVISLLPKFEPGKIRQRPVNVKFTYPLNIKLK